MFSRRSATRDNNASNSSTKNCFKALKLRSKVQARRFSQHLRELSACFERLSKKGFTFGREPTDLSKHFDDPTYTQKTINVTSAIALVSFVLDLSSDIVYIW